VKNLLNSIINILTILIVCLAILLSEEYNSGGKI